MIKKRVQFQVSFSMCADTCQTTTTNFTNSTQILWRPVQIPHKYHTNCAQFVNPACSRTILGLDGSLLSLRSQSCISFCKTIKDKYHTICNLNFAFVSQTKNKPKPHKSDCKLICVGFVRVSLVGVSVTIL